MTKPFTRGPVSRFLLYCILTFAILVILFVLLTRAKGRESLTPGNKISQFEHAPQPLLRA